MDVNGLSEFKLTEIDWELLQSIGMVLQVSFCSDHIVAFSTRFSGSSQSPARNVRRIDACVIERCRDL